MTGSFLTRVARTLTREETFEHMVAPAIADLQRDADSTATRRLSHYAGVVVVLGVALLRDTRADTGRAWGPETGPVWTRTALWYLAFIVAGAGVILWADTPWHLLGSRGRAAWATSLFVSNLVAFFPWTLVVAAFYLRRRALGSYRTLAVAMVISAGTFLTVQAIGRAAIGSLDRVVYASAVRSMPPEVTSADPDAASSQKDWRSWLERRRARGQPAPATGRTATRAMTAGAFIGGVVAVLIAYPVYLTPYALVGFVLARHRTWTIPLVLVGVTVTFVGLQGLMIGGMGHPGDRRRSPG